MDKKDSRFYLSRKLVYIVTLFIGAASGLVVMTNFAINMIAASRDYTSLLSQWSRYHYQADLFLERYARNGKADDYRTYRQIKERGSDLDRVINELFKPETDAKLIFDSFSSDNVHPNEIATLITTFRWFQDYEKVRRVRQVWNTLERIEDRREKLISGLYTAWDSGNSEAAFIQASTGELSRLNQQWAQQNQRLMARMGDISLVIRHFGLWVSVILGILLVLIGVVISVRANKSIGKWELTLKERDNLARFPELNPNPVMQIDREGNITFQNEAARALFPDLGQKGLSHPFLKHIPEYLSKPVEDINRSYVHELKIGEVCYQQLINYISEERGFHVYAQDITENKRQQKKISDSLREKEILLAEIHHRVKNNLAVISGLLELESMQSRNPKLALKESRTRIKSMAMIHEILYESNSFSEVDLREYMHRLMEHIKSNYIRKRDYQVFRTSFDSVKLNINQAVPLGLILNEVLTNAIEHGFGNGNDGEIQICLRDLGDEVSLSIRDNGGGFPDGLDFESSKSVGFVVIRALIKQLKASVDVESNGGVEFNLQFAKSDATGSSNNFL